MGGEKKCAHGYKGTTPAPPKAVKVKTVEVKPVQKVTTVHNIVQRPAPKVTVVDVNPKQKVTTVNRPVQKVTTVKRPVKTTTVKLDVKPKQTGPPWCEWRGETSGRWVCDVDWSQSYGYEDLLEKVMDQGWEWTAQDCGALPFQQMITCEQSLEMWKRDNDY